MGRNRGRIVDISSTRGAGNGAARDGKRRDFTEPPTNSSGTAPSATSAAPAGNDDAPLLKLLDLIGSIAAFTTALTALLYYFGWVRTNAVFRYFGVDPAMLKFGLPEYLARSAGPAFRPLVLLLLITALVLLVGRAVDAAERRPWVVSITFVRRGWTVRPVASLLVVAGLVGLYVGIAEAVGLLAAPPVWAAALALAVGALAVWHGGRHLASRSGSLRGPSVVERSLLFGVVLSALFWSTAAYSQRVGEQLAQFIDADPATSQPEVTIHSVADLNLWSQPDAALEPGKFPHTYRGFRLLAYANDRWFLLTGELTASGRHRVLVLLDDESVRVDLSA